MTHENSEMILPVYLESKSGLSIVVNLLRPSLFMGNGPSRQFFEFPLILFKL